MLEKFLDVENVSFRVRVENDDVIEVGDYVNEALVNLIDDLDELSRRRVAPLRHDEPFEEACGRAESRERDRVFVDLDYMERRHQIEQGENSSATQLFEDMVDSGYGELSKNADVVQLFVVDRESNSTRFPWDDNHRARVWRGEMLHKAGREIPVKNGVHLFGHARIHAVAAGRHRGAVRRARKLEWQEGARAKVGR